MPNLIGVMNIDFTCNNKFKMTIGAEIPRLLALNSKNWFEEFPRLKINARIKNALSLASSFDQEKLRFLAFALNSLGCLIKKSAITLNNAGNIETQKIYL